MATLVSAATITTVVGTEISALGLNPGASPGSYVYKLDVNALAAGEVLFIREYNIISLAAANLLSAAASSFEDGTTGGWVLASNCSISNVGTQHLDGTHALQMSSTAAGNMSVTSSTGANGMAVVPGATYGGIVFFKTASLARSCQVIFQWFNGSNATVLRTDTGAVVTDASGSWTPAVVASVAPVGAAYVTLQAVVQSTSGAAELHFIDCAEIGPLLGVNLMTANQSSLELNLTNGWSAGTNCSISTNNSNLSLDGLFGLALDSTAGGAMTAVSSSVLTPVVAGRTYTAVASFQSASVLQSVRVDITWENAAGSVLSTTTGTAATEVAGTWTQVTASGVAPATATSAFLTLNVLNTGGASELHNVDCIGILDGATTAWVLGGTQPGGWSIGGVERLNYFGSYIAGSDADPLIETVPILVDVNSRLTLQQKNGSPRSIPVKVLKL